MWTKEKKWVWLEVLVAVFVMAIGVFFGSRWIGETWAFFPYKWQLTSVVNKPVPGGFVELEVDVSRIAVCPSEFYRELYDGQGTRVSQRQWTQGGKPIGEEKYRINIPVPAEAKPGSHARYCFSQSPKCNVLQNMITYWTPLKCYPFTMEGTDQ